MKFIHKTLKVIVLTWKMLKPDDSEYFDYLTDALSTTIVTSTKITDKFF